MWVYDCLETGCAVARVKGDGLHPGTVHWASNDYDSTLSTMVSRAHVCIPDKFMKGALARFFPFMNSILWWDRFDAKTRVIEIACDATEDNFFAELERGCLCASSIRMGWMEHSWIRVRLVRKDIGEKAFNSHTWSKLTHLYLHSRRWGKSRLVKWSSSDQIF